MMTRHEKRLAEVLLGAIGGLEGEQAVERLFGLGLVNLRACEQRAVRARVDRLAEEGVPRCKAMHVTDRKSTRLNSSHSRRSRMPSSA